MGLPPLLSFEIFSVFGLVFLVVVPLTAKSKSGHMWQALQTAVNQKIKDTNCEYEFSEDYCRLSTTFSFAFPLVGC